MCRTTGWQGDDSSNILVKTSSCTPHVLRGSVRSNPTSPNANIFSLLRRCFKRRYSSELNRVTFRGCNHTVTPNPA
ncbi:hypothetical protein DPMN_041435 [Dreissena polymorpha]|uniref:Uncharacterized protein n=1 Tax=Dreissena polymorpha TaxID=45954 RepID=A0A9D4CZ21_DREPO|nr:hypothetical protein DPMN_041435 [Dreissena polymorpha]